MLRRLTDSLGETEAGILITLDEIRGADIDELRAISDVIQHSFREERPVAFIAAGLPHGVDSLLNDDVSTFIRRAQRYELGPVSDVDVRRALQVPIEAADREITASALDQAVEATGGYPFMIQLTGYHLYRHTEHQMIDRAAAATAIPAAQRRLGKLV